MSETTMTFGDLLRRLRSAAGLSQEALAERAGLSRNGISDLERGRHPAPRLETVRLLAKGLALTDEDRTALLVAARPAVWEPAPVTQAPQAAVTVPRPLTRLIGREKEVRSLRNRLQDESVRLLTLTGPGGVGKTRLAIEVAGEPLECCPDGVVFVDCTPLTDPDLVVSTLAAALGVREVAGRLLLETLAAFLAPKRLLLVLDSCERVLAVAPQIAMLLGASPGLAVLATSREPFRMHGEREYPVLPLPPPDPHRLPALAEVAQVSAVALFVERATAVRPTFALTEGNAVTIAAICARLDGLPLAIELAAARIKHLPLATLLTRLEHRLPLLTGGGRDLPARQRTMRDTIAWSYALLGPEARALFHRLAVFVGGWTLEAAEAVTNVTGDLDVLEGLSSLADVSLIQLDESDAAPRYRMLETIREFAQEQLRASGEEAAVQRSHASYFLVLVEQAKPQLLRTGQRAWMRSLEAEQPNVRAALDVLAASDDFAAHLRLAVNLGHFWFRRSHFVEGRVHLETALARVDAHTPERAEALKWLGAFAFGQSDLVAAESWLRQSEALARRLHALSLLFEALFWRGVVAEWEDDDSRAVPLYEAALVVAHELNDPLPVGSALNALSYAAYRRGDLATAGRLGKLAVARIRTIGDAFELSVGLANIGAVALAGGDTARASVAYTEALDCALGIDAEWLIASALAGFAAVAAARGDHAGAARLLGATEAAREASHHARIPTFTHLAQTTLAVRAAVGEADFVAAWEAGHAMLAEDAVDLPRSLGLLEESIPLSFGTQSVNRL